MQELKYQIFQITEDGLMKRPTMPYMELKERYKYHYFSSPEEAVAELNKDNQCGDYVILPVSTYLHDFS